MSIFPVKTTLGRESLFSRRLSENMHCLQEVVLVGKVCHMMHMEEIHQMGEITGNFDLIKLSVW